MPVQLGGQPQAGFDQPVDLMMDCHRRIEKFLDVLLRIVERTRGGELDREHRDALETALNYFRSAAPRHTEDEEHSLFPRLRQSSDPAVRAALAKMDALEADHRVADAHHQRVDELGRAWLERGRLEGDAAAELQRLLAELAATYQRHIRIEDEEVFPLAAGALSPDEIAAVGQEMKQRRASQPGRAESRCAQRRRQTLREEA